MYAFVETEQLNIGLLVRWLPPCMSERAETDTTSSRFPMAGPYGARPRASIGQLKAASLKAALTSTGGATMNIMRSAGLCEAAKDGGLLFSYRCLIAGSDAEFYFA